MMMRVTCKSLIQICKFKAKGTIIWYNILSRKRKKWNWYIASELNKLPCNPTNNFPLKICLFDTEKLLRKAIKIKLVYNGWGITFDGECYWSFNNDFAGNIAGFGVDNTQWSDTDQQQKKFLGLGEEPIDGINDSTGTPGKEIALTLVIKKNFAKVYITMVMRVTCK